MIRDNNEAIHLNPTEPMTASSDIVELHAEDFPHAVTLKIW